MDWTQVVAGLTTLLSGIGGAVAKQYSDSAATWKRLWEEERADNVRYEARIEKFYEEGRQLAEQRAAELQEVRRELDATKQLVFAREGGKTDVSAG
jgi:hypothetical protein